MDRIDLNRIYWASNPEMLFELDVFKKRNVRVNSFGKGNLSVHFTNEDGSKGQICSPENLKPLLKNIGSITNDEVRELLDVAGYASATIVEVGKSRYGSGYLDIAFSVEDQYDTYTYNIWIEGTFTFTGTQESYNRDDEQSISFRWMRVIDFLRSKGYNLDFKEGEFIDVTAKPQSYLSLNNKYSEPEILEFATLGSWHITDCTSNSAIDPLDKESLPEITLAKDLEDEPTYQFVYVDGWESFEKDLDPRFTLLYINQ